MKKIYWFILLIFLCLPISFCTKEFKYELPKVDPKVAILSINDPENEFLFEITMAKPFRDSIIKLNSDCKVDLYEDDHFLTTLKLDMALYNKNTYNQRLLKFSADSGLRFIDGKEYNVKVKYPGIDPVTSKTDKPVHVIIKEVTWTQYDDDMPNWYSVAEGMIFQDILPIKRPYIEWTITFDDPSGFQNYYRIGVNYQYSCPRSWSLNASVDGRLQYASSSLPDPVYMHSKYLVQNQLEPYEHPLFQYTKEILWSDNEFNGTEHSIKIVTPRPSQITGDLYFNPVLLKPSNFKYIISLYTLSEDYYKYWVDRWKFMKSSQISDPFAEPMKFHSNTSNGCGIFAFSSLDRDTIEMNVNF